MAIHDLTVADKKQGRNALNSKRFCGIAVISAIYAQKDIKKASEDLKEATIKMVESK